MPFNIITNWCFLITITRVTANVGRGQARIVGGEYTTIEKHPYMVEIMVSGRHTCGGCILNSQWILTAAHCTAAYDPHKPIKYKLYVGSTNSGEGSPRDVIMVVVHELFNRNDDLYADIAMMKAKSSFEFSDKISKINVPMAPKNYNHCVTAGWGKSDKEDRTILQELELHTISYEECEKYYMPFRSNICVLAYDEGAAPCFGDSGGPLVCDGELAGLLSCGSQQCDRQEPEVYTSVAAYYTWIRDVLRKDTAKDRTILAYWDML